MLLSVIMSWSFLCLSELVRLPNQIFVSLSTEFQILSESDAYTPVPCSIDLHSNNNNSWYSFVAKLLELFKIKQEFKNHSI